MSYEFEWPKHSHSAPRMPDDISPEAHASVFCTGNKKDDCSLKGSFEAAKHFGINLGTKRTVDAR